MRKLGLFQQFDFASWQKGKRFLIRGVRYNEKRHCVTLDVIIFEDHTDYGDPRVTNLYETFKVHCIKDENQEDCEKYSGQRELVFKSVGKCTVWGDYNSNLSVEAVVEAK